MFFELRDRKHCFAASPALRHCCSWILCALLLILSAGATLARYETHTFSAKLATTQRYLDGKEILRKLPRVAPPILLWYAGMIAASLTVLSRSTLLRIDAPAVPAFRGFVPHLLLRSPPVR